MAQLMSDAELYHFDLTGYVIVRNVLSDDELRIANEAIDRQELDPSPTYSGSSVSLAGEMRADGSGPITRLGNTQPLLEMGAPAQLSPSPAACRAAPETMSLAAAAAAWAGGRTEQRTRTVSRSGTCLRTPRPHRTSTRSWARAGA